ncbi:hypothetical protein [Geopsychrobacter electrodiphilus]|uniref:hypothetical protein n=1 Tax=Geopsychrobacter electrodiphilus TaxID=225196 RepID=UPI00036D034F|nr:hypothetical protein [Geopsychrobacter electrodiphilus]
MEADLLRRLSIHGARFLGLVALCLASTLVPAFSAQIGGTSASPVVALPADGQLYFGQIDFGNSSPLARGGFSIKGGRHIIYLVDAEPGESYTFGLRMPNLGLPEMDVMLFDRWPNDTNAKMQHLSSGPILMSNQDYIEYQWHIGVSAKSQGNLLYLVVELKKPLKAEYRRFPVRAFWAHPPIDPMRSTGRGVTYARGPLNLMLQERDNSVRVVQMAQPEPGWSRDDNRVPPFDIGMIHNGHFHDGLRSWNIISAAQDQKELGVSVGEQGLRLWAKDLDQRAGIEQNIAAQGVSAQAHLTLELRVNRQTQQDKFQGLGDFPLRLDLICQPTGKNPNETPRQFSRAFSVIRPTTPASLRSMVVQVPLKAWYRYETGLSDWLPQSCRLKGIRLSGGGFPERNVQIRQVQIVQE